MNPQLEWEPERREPDFRRWRPVPVLLAGAAALMVVVLYQMCKLGKLNYVAGAEILKRYLP